MRIAYVIRSFLSPLRKLNGPGNGNGLRQNTIVQNVHGHLHVIKVFTF